MTRTLCHQQYWKQKRGAKGLLRQYIASMTGWSSAGDALDRALPKGWSGEGAQLSAHRFPGRYTAPILNCWQRWMKRMKHCARRRRRFCTANFTNTARTLPAARHLGAAYLQSAQEPALPPASDRLSEDQAGASGHWRTTQPNPEGKPGYLRIDTVHQGDREGQRCVPHQCGGRGDAMAGSGATAQISEAWLMPVLEAMLRQFPFRILGFHSDNGSEFINHTVAQLCRSC